jgi:helicase
MRLKELRKYDIPDSILEAWLKRQGDYLLPLQEKAIRAGLLDYGQENEQRNLLISAPTSSGKSFCGEMAAIASLLRRKKAVILLPLKSIAEEKYSYFTDCYRASGLKTIIATGDHPENDDDFQLGNFDLALAIYEKFNRLLTVNLDILGQVGLVVVDELQMIGDSTRGPELEMALTKVLASGYQPRIIALSAVIADQSDPADWLKCATIAETVRPIDLLQGVAAAGRFHFRSFNSGLEGKEKIAFEGGDNPGEELIQFLKNDESRKLVFLKSRRDTIEAAFRLAAAVNWETAGTTLAQLEGEEASFLIRSLRQVLSRGVAFHNADLTPSQRQAIEEGYRKGEIRIIFTTTTLAMGVNLPAETVLLETMKYTGGGFAGKPLLAPISVADFQNITGRAGRFGLGPGGAPGRAIIIAGSPFEYDVLWSSYIEADRSEKVASAFDVRKLDDIILDLIVCGFGPEPDALARVLSDTFYARRSTDFGRDRLAETLDRLSAGGFIDREFRPHPIGAAVAGSGISVSTCQSYLRLLNRGYPEDIAGWLFLALSADEFDTTRAGMTSVEYRHRLYEKLLYQSFNESVGEINNYLDIKIGQGPLDFRRAACLKSVLLLSEWASGEAVERLEQRYQLHHGQIIGLAEMAGWLLSSAGRVIHAIDCHSRLPGLVDDYAFNVQFGVSPEMKEVYRVAGPILTRSDYKLLAEKGIKAADDLRSASQESLSQIIGSARRAERLQRKIRDISKEDKMSRRGYDHTVEVYHSDAPMSGPRGRYPSLVEIDGDYERERYLVKIDGFPVRLTGKSFKYLTKLVFSRIMGGEGWIYKDDIEVGFNQARYLYRLKQEMKSAGVPWAIFENNRLGYYRLDLDSSKIRLNFDNLKSHHDFELRQMADQLAPRMTG